jgi:hypothetical protein
LKLALLLSATLPSAAIWSGLGWLVASRLGHHSLAVLAIAYALWYGWAETTLRPSGAPGLSWQVPAKWVKRDHPIIGAVVWGTTLGPGFVTRNPYAGFWLALMLVALNPTGIAGLMSGAVVGGAHGLARGTGILWAVSRTSAQHSATAALVWAQLRWKIADGLATAFVAGALLGTFQ